ncbi:hypothetical protein KKA47_01885 [bacterium]|nr:hypothetical protein [bacterium]
MKSRYIISILIPAMAIFFFACSDGVKPDVPKEEPKPEASEVKAPEEKQVVKCIAVDLVEVTETSEISIDKNGGWTTEGSEEENSKAIAKKIDDITAQVEISKVISSEPKNSQVSNLMMVLQKAEEGYDLCEISYTSSHCAGHKCTNMSGVLVGGEVVVEKFIDEESVVSASYSLEYEESELIESEIKGTFYITIE